MTLRVLVVEDSATVRNHLCEILAGDPDIEVVGAAEDGRRAIVLCEALRPDVVSMDMMLPGTTGLSATEHIMAHCPTPILIVSSSTNRGEIFKTYEALAAGAVDVLEKPSGSEPEGSWERRYLATLKLVSRVKPITHLRGRIGSLGTPRAISGHAPPPTTAARTAPQVIAIGASTGGPGALLDVLRGMSSGIPIPIIIVLHISEPFGAAFAEWLDAQTSFRVSYGIDGRPVGDTAGQVTMAAPDSHLLVRDGRFRLSRGPERHSCRPSVDVLFESLAIEYGGGAVGCLLTGMGRDGAAGLLEMRRKGAITIAQDEASSVVYGMPREAMLIGAAERILPLNEIGPQLAEIAVAGRGRAR